MAPAKKTTNFLETDPIGLIQKRINESTKEISRVNDAMGLGHVVVKHNGVFRTFNDGTSILIKKGNFRRKRLSNRRFKIQ